MKLKTFDVKIYYTTLCEYTVKAKDAAEAIRKGRRLKIKEYEIMNNLEPWDEADTVEECERL